MGCSQAWAQNLLSILKITDFPSRLNYENLTLMGNTLMKKFCGISFEMQQPDSKLVLVKVLLKVTLLMQPLKFVKKSRF